MYPGADGVLCVDWFNGCRTPLMDGNLRGGFLGLTLRHEPLHMYRALLESNAYGLRWIVDLLREGGVPVKKFIATGGLAHRNPLFVQVAADVLGENILIHPSQQGACAGRRDSRCGGCGQAGGRLQFRALRSPHDRGRKEGCQRARRHFGSCRIATTPSFTNRCICAIAKRRHSCSGNVLYHKVPLLVDLPAQS